MYVGGQGWTNKKKLYEKKVLQKKSNDVSVMSRGLVNEPRVYRVHTNIYGRGLGGGGGEGRGCWVHVGIFQVV